MGGTSSKNGEEKGKTCFPFYQEFFLVCRLIFPESWWCVYRVSVCTAGLIRVILLFAVVNATQLSLLPLPL